MIDHERLEKYMGVVYNTIYHEPDTPNFHNTLMDMTWDQLLSKINLAKETKILDVGCGSGYFLSKLKENGYTNINGITMDDTDIEQCKKLYDIDVAKSDFTFTDFEDNSIEFLHCRQALEHSVWPFLTLLEFNRILEKGKMAYIDVPAPDTTRNNEVNENHFSVLGKKMWIELFKKAGFSLTFESTFQFDMNDNVSPDVTLKHTEQFYLFLITKERHMV